MLNYANALYLSGQKSDFIYELYRGAEKILGPEAVRAGMEAYTNRVAGEQGLQ